MCRYEYLLKEFGWCRNGVVLDRQKIYVKLYMDLDLGIVLHLKL